MQARAVKAGVYKRSVDPIFGKVESFRLVFEHRVEIAVGKARFTSNQAYPSDEAARRAAKRISTRQPIAPQ